MNAMSRSENMRHIRSQDTFPEMTVRRLAHGLGYRYRLHCKDLPGKPDLVFPGRRKVIFVHGCFWHQHPECREGRLPKSNTVYWRPKLKRNIKRDKAVQAQLNACGWDVLVIWECETKNREAICQALLDFLGPQHQAGKILATNRRDFAAGRGDGRVRGQLVHRGAEVKKAFLFRQQGEPS